MSEFKINASDRFEHLPNAPIVEALIDFRARATVPWDEASFGEALKPMLPDYPTMTVQNSLVVGLMLKPGISAETREHDSWKGLQFKSADGFSIATFNRDGYTFSRLRPYQDWNHLEDETIRLWKLHSELVRPAEIQRMGVRFINRIDLPNDGKVRIEDYIDPYPLEPKGLELPFAGFLHIDTFAVPGYSYSLNVARNFQPPQPPLSAAWGFILDIDVSTLQSLEIGDFESIKKRFSEMRWLKNKAFFGSITERTKQSYK